MSLFKQALERSNSNCPPVWFMRQAGRYHSHYQNLRKSHSFVDLCKKPELAAETTFGPIQDFDYDAAILFSDLLFPLDCIGMGLSYDNGPPELEWHLKSKADLGRLNMGLDLFLEMDFQKLTLEKIRSGLSQEKGLIGFVGAPLTLFAYAVEGSHKGDLSPTRRGLTDGRFEGFCEGMIPFLIGNMGLQAQGGADAIALFDTCAGEFDAETYRSQIVPTIDAVIRGFKETCSNMKIIYYSKGTGMDHWSALEDLPIDCLGVDWRTPLHQVIDKYHSHWAIQGNFDPNALLLPTVEFKPKLDAYFDEIEKIDRSKLQGWISGLGHGVLPKTPEENVRIFIKEMRERFGK